MSKRKCVVCGKDPADGFASINDQFYCHGDDEDPTCYMRSQGDYLPTIKITPNTVVEPRNPRWSMSWSPETGWVDHS